jgi:hypothetical protein
MTFKTHKITTNVLIKETACQCGCGMGFFPGNASDDTISHIFFLAQNVQILINHLQVSLEFPQAIKIYAQFNSWCRCVRHNKKEGGAKNSIHKTGGAVDLVLYYGKPRIYIRPKVICRAALLLNEPKITAFGGIGCYHNRVHLDIREGTMVTWFKRQTKYPNGTRYTYNVDFTEDIALV